MANKEGEQVDTLPSQSYGWSGTQPVKMKVDSLGNLILSGLVPAAYDYISLSYTSTNLTGVVYKTGGSGGTTVATLTIAYSGTDISSVTRT